MFFYIIPLDAYEIYYIDYFNTLAPIGYNLESGGKSGKERYKKRKPKKSNIIRQREKSKNTIGWEIIQ